MTTEQRFTFDEIAELYDRHRPQYPDALFEDMIRLSAISQEARILEIGCGTGQATIPLAQRGFRVLCLEPGAAMVRFAQRKLAHFRDVEVVQLTFEAWPVEPCAFSLVVSAQAFHWVTPEVRFTKAAAALNASGALAILGNAVVLEQSPLRQAIDAVYARRANPAWPARYALVLRRRSCSRAIRRLGLFRCSHIPSLSLVADLFGIRLL